MDVPSEKKSPDAPKSGQLREKIEAALEPIPDTPLKAQVAQRVFAVVAEERFSGPLAHPRHMEAYERICPGLADRITKMAELAQVRREDRADKVLDNEYKDRRLGMHYGFAALMVLLACGTAVIVTGHPYLGGTIISASAIGACVIPFINGRRSQSAMTKIAGDAPARATGRKTPK
jgi:uncharacterized membrane protein